MSKNLLSSTTYILLAILIIASFLRLYNLTELPPGLYPDEAMNGNNAVEAWTNKDWKVFYPENNGREGLFMNIQSFFVAAFGNEPWALRLPSALFGILTVLGLYFLTKALIKDPNVVILATFLLATSFWHINFSRIGFRAIMAPFFLVWALYFLFLALKKIDLSSVISRWSLAMAAVGGLLYGLGFHSYIAYRATPLLIVFILWLWGFKLGWKPVIKIGIVFIVFAILTASPLGIHFLKQPSDFLGRTTQLSIFASPTPWQDLGKNIIKTAGMFNFVGDWNWRHNIAGRPMLFWPVGIFFLTGLFFALKKIFSDNWRSSESIILSWLIIAALPVIISNEGLPHALRAILMAPPVFILAGMGALKLYPLIKNWPRITVYALLFLLAFDAFVSYFGVWGKNSNIANAFSQNYVEIGREINQLPKELPKYVIVETPGVIVRGIPMPAQTTMFITDTFNLEKRKEKNIIYLLPDQLNQIPANQKNHVIKTL